VSACGTSDIDRWNKGSETWNILSRRTKKEGPVIVAPSLFSEQKDFKAQGVQWPVASGQRPIARHVKEGLSIVCRIDLGGRARTLSSTFPIFSGVVGTAAPCLQAGALAVSQPSTPGARPLPMMVLLYANVPGSRASKDTPAFTKALPDRGSPPEMASCRFAHAPRLLTHPRRAPLSLADTNIIKAFRSKR
jgi:hypothetical protein